MKEFVSSHQSTLTNFLGAFAGGAIAIAVLYAFMPNTAPLQANNNSRPAAVSAAASNDVHASGSCNVESASTSSGSHHVVTKAAYMPAHHSIERIFSHTTSTSSNNSGTNTNSNNTTTTTTTNTNSNNNTNSSSASGNGGLVGVGANLLNNSLNGNEVNVPILSGNDVNVLNNSDVLSENEVLNDSNVLNDVLDGTVLVKTVGGIL